MSTATATRAAYLICATPRTGSYLLCDALGATGVAGRPTEYLMTTYCSDRMSEWGVSSYREFHAGVLAEGTTDNGVFGAKLHAAQLIDLMRRATGHTRVGLEDQPAVLRDWFPDVRYVWLRRRDRVAQGVSWTKAVQSRVWFDTDAPPARIPGEATPELLRFDYAAIERAVFALAIWDGVWRTFFQQNALEPVTVWYEDLVAERAATVRRVLEHLGLDPAAAQLQAPPSFRRQADGTSARWKDRYERLERVRREATFASLAGLHDGETVYVCAGRTDARRVPRDAVTIALDGAASPAPASFALLTRRPASPPAADVAVTVGRVPVDHSFVVPCALQRGNDAAATRNSLVVDSDAGVLDMATAFARHLGASRIEFA